MMRTLRPTPLAAEALKIMESELARTPLDSTKPAPDPESSIELLARLKNGDEMALEQLFGRYLVPLRRWAHGRLPQWARSMSDTQDLVQDSIVRVLGRLASFHPERPGSLHAYLRTSVLNRIYDELRQAHRRPQGVELDDDLASALPSPYESAVGRENLEIFEAALSELNEGDRELVIARVEWDLSYGEVAAALGKPSSDAARVAVRRALLKLAEIMSRHRNIAARNQTPGRTNAGA
jgi:RNA polymerase sigma-70 factor (ECF subfamily)